MDVPLWPRRALGIVCLLLGFSACGNHYNLSTDSGRQARIDDANLFLSEGQCDSAMNAIDPLYNSGYVDDEVRIVKASAYACKGTFNFLTLASNLSQPSNYFNALVKSLSNTPNDGARASMYSATDVLTQNGAQMAASGRTTAVNTYMVFLQLGIVGTILRNYGSPALDGSQGAALVYSTSSNPAGEMTNLDACALTASLSILVDSFSHSNLADPDTAAVTTMLNGICVGAGLSSCAQLNLSRNACDGTNTDSQAASLVVAGVNAGW